MNFSKRILKTTWSRQTISLLALTLLLSIANFFFNANAPVRGLMPDEISFEELNKIEEPYLIIDARSQKDFKAASIAGAVNLPPENFDEALGNLLDIYEPNKLLIVFCDSSICETSRDVAERLRNECGMKNVLIFKDDWRKLIK